jgi:cobalt-zinc-cadmium efflux system protein
VSAWLLAHAKSLNVRGAYVHVLPDALSSVAVLAGGAVMYATGGL